MCAMGMNEFLEQWQFSCIAGPQKSFIAKWELSTDSLHRD